MEAEWFRALDWRPGSNHAAATSLRNFGNSVYPALPVSFRGDTKRRRSLLPGAYARGSKISHLTSATMQRKTLPCTKHGRRRRMGLSWAGRLQSSFALQSHYLIVSHAVWHSCKALLSSLLWKHIHSSSNMGAIRFMNEPMDVHCGLLWQRHEWGSGAWQCGLYLL